MVDPPLMERVIANVVISALRYSPDGSPPLLTAIGGGGRVELRVMDRGPGVPEADRDQIFMPFQRLGDIEGTTGVGLGLTVARGLTEAMHGTLEPEQTPGGGLTMAISVPAAPGQPRHIAAGAIAPFHQPTSRRCLFRRPQARPKQTEQAGVCVGRSGIIADS
jgi:two-component system, OmpR family, sensor histidine kinase KdpD